MLASLGVTNSLTCSGLSLKVRGTSAPNGNEYVSAESLHEACTFAMCSSLGAA